MGSNSVLISFSRVLGFIPSYSQIFPKFFPNLIKTSPSSCKRLRHIAASLFIPFPFAIWMKLKKRCLRFRKDTRWSFLRHFVFCAESGTSSSLKSYCFMYACIVVKDIGKSKTFCNQYSFFIGGICPVPEQTIPVQ